MRRLLGLTLAAAIAVTGLTACMSDDNESVRGERRAAALVPAGPGGANMQLTLDAVTPAGQAIEVMSYSWGGQTPQGGVPQLSELKITKKMDESSPKLFESLATGRRSATAVLKLYSSSGGGQVNYATFTLEQVLVVNVQTAGNGDDYPSEEVSLAYSRIRQETRIPDHTGAAGPPVRFSWDLVARRPW